MKTRPTDIESENTCSDNGTDCPVGVLGGQGVRGRKYARVSLRLTPAIVSRFWSKVQKNSPDQCWPWTAGTIGYGYGQFNAGRDASGRQDTRYAHRVAFQIATGIDPMDAVVMHSCDHAACCNPAHLSLGTQADNVHDASRKGKYLRGLTPGSHRWKQEQRRLGLLPDRRRKAA